MNFLTRRNVVCILHRYTGIYSDEKTWYVDYAFNSYFTRKIKQNDFTYILTVLGRIKGYYPGMAVPGK